MNLNKIKKTVSGSLVASMVIACVLSNTTPVFADEITPDSPAENVTATSEDTITEEPAEEITEEELVSADEETTTDEIESVAAEDIAVPEEQEEEAAEEDTAVLPSSTDSEQTDVTAETSDEDETAAEESDAEPLDVITELEPVDISLNFCLTDDALNANTVPLNGNSQIIYNELTIDVRDVTAGNRSDTDFEIPVSALGYDPCTSVNDTSYSYWYASDLGVSTISYDGNNIEQAAYEAYADEVVGNYDLICDKLLAENPLDAFWIDKTAGMALRIETYLATDSVTGEYVIVIGNNINIELPPCAAYKGSSTFSVSSNAVARANTARTNAQAIVNRYSTLSDIDKLYAYKNEICDLVEYDHAIANTNYAYGNESQILNVFDNDPNTNVICEGYAKAFKYLCDLSTFNNSTTFCITVSGADHMWDIMTINGLNYIVDPTNCDQPGWPEDQQPFLKVPITGTYSTQYVLEYYGGTTITYRYSSETLLVYDSSRLTLCMTKYGWYTSNGHTMYRTIQGIVLKNRWQLIDNKWYHFDANGYVQTGWQKIGQKWYYFNPDGVMKTGWHLQNGNYYYLNSLGDMQIGWKQIRGKWYYFDGLGHMITGWEKIGGYWYFFEASGEMRTGWLHIGSVWYYMDPSGHMVTGWSLIKGEWYYFYDSGVMVTGWLNVGGKWYYMDSNGHMLRNTRIGSYVIGPDGVCINC